MAESSIKRSLRPARMLTTAIMAGLALVAATLTWPALVKATGTPPSITLVQVASSKGGFFYSPLTDAGGSVYFNNLSGQGGDQVITVTVAVSDDNPALFSGGYAFGSAPTTSVPNTDGTWSVTYTVSSSATTENGILFAITDGDGLSNTVTISFTRDITPPAVAFTGVTAQQYLSGTTRWYRTPALTAGWAFTAAFTETDAGFDSSLAAWDHQTDDADDQAILPFLSGPAALTGTFTHVYTDADGTVVASLVVTDHVGNSASTSMTLGLDGSAPSIGSPGIVEHSRYLYATGTGIYYGNGMGSGGAPFTVTGNADDDGGVGLDHATFSSALAAPPPPDDLDPATWAGVYTATSACTGTGTIVVTVTDRVGNAVTQTFAYTRDTTPPDLPTGFYQYPDDDSNNDGFAPAPGWEDDWTIDLRWNASQDSGSGLRTYHLGTSHNPSAPDVPQNSPITVTADDGYSFYLTAEDNVGNISSEASVGTIYVDHSSPTGGNLDLTKLTGGQYLYIAASTGITTGTLYYNNSAASSFVITGNIPVGNWGYFGPSEAGKVAFSASWGDSSRAEDTLAPYTHTYIVNSGETDNGFTVFFVNKAGNVQPITIANTLDVTAPLVSLTGVTDPQYDPDHNELGTAGNWYRTSALGGGWTFTSSVTETLSGLSSSLAVWSHSVPSNSQTIVPGLTGSGTFTNVVNDSDGVVTVTVTLTDHVNNAASDSVVIRLDGTPPTIATGSWGESSPYLVLVGNVLYYNPAMPVVQTATLSGTASDGGSGLDYAAFSQSSSLPSTPISDTSPVSWSTVYSFSSATQGNQVNVVAYDHVGNAVTATYAYTRAPGLPSVHFQNVTDPGYDPNPPEYDTQGNWYRSSNFNAGSGAGWWFTSAFTDGSGTGISAASATWDHATGQDYVIALSPDMYNHTIDGTFQDVASAPDGLVTVTLTITDNVGQVASTTLVLRIDNTPPSITAGGWSESSPYLYASADGSTLYFSHLMGLTLQTAVLSGTATEIGGAGLWKAVFSGEGSFGGETTDYSPANWSNNYYLNTNSFDTESPIAVVVSDYLGNAVTRTFTYTLDTTPPAVRLTDVTNPQYDSDSNELGTIGNWYRTGALSSGWSFTATVTETVAGVGQDQAMWDSTANDRYTTLGISGTGVFTNRTGTFTNVTGTPDGLVTVTLAVTDRVGNMGSDFLVVQLDGSPPVITPTGWSESSPYLYAAGNTLYFSNLMGSTMVTATVSGAAADGGVGLSLATFSDERPYLAMSPGPAASPAAWSGTYGITSTSTSVGDGTVLVTVYDLVSNTATSTFSYVKDTAGPTVSFTDVTAPQYDPDGNKLNATGNWYRTSLLTGGWAFTGTISDSAAGPKSAQATWDNPSCPITCNQTIDPGLDGDGVFTGVYTNPDGAVTVRLRGTDNVSNTGVASLTIHLDNTAPSVPSDFEVTSPGLPGGYYSTTLLSLDWDAASDPSGSGVGAYLLGITPSPVVSYTAPTSYNVGSAGVYTFYLRAADNVGNLGTVTSAGPITVDTQAPVPHIQATPKDSEGRILLGWDAHDATTWPVAYDVEYSLTGTGNWHGWITNTSSISAYFGPDTPIHVETDTPYYARVRVRDYVGNQSVWTQTVFSLGLKRVHLPFIIYKYDPTIPVFRSGDFESGTFAGWKVGDTLDNWKVGDTLPYTIVKHPVQPTGGTPPNGGTYTAMLGSPNYACDAVPVTQAYIQAYVDVPDGTSHVRFSYRVISYDVLQSQGRDWDRLEVQVNGNRLDPASGNPYGNRTMNHGCNISPYDSGWIDASLDLSAYAGRTVILTFFNENHGDKWYNTWSYLDNIRIVTP